MSKVLKDIMENAAKKIQKQYTELIEKNAKDFLIEFISSNYCVDDKPENLSYEEIIEILESNNLYLNVEYGNEENKTIVKFKLFELKKEGGFTYSIKLHGDK